MDIYAKLKELLQNQVSTKKFDIDQVTPDTKLEELGLDSLDAAELIINIEEEFNLPEVTQEEMMEIKTVQELKELVEKKRV